MTDWNTHRSNREKRWQSEFAAREKAARKTAYALQQRLYGPIPTRYGLAEYRTTSAPRRLSYAKTYGYTPKELRYIRSDAQERIMRREWESTAKARALDAARRSSAQERSRGVGPAPVTKSEAIWRKFGLDRESIHPRERRIAPRVAPLPNLPRYKVYADVAQPVALWSLPPPVQARAVVAELTRGQPVLSTAARRHGLVATVARLIARHPLLRAVQLAADLLSVYQAAERLGVPSTTPPVAIQEGYDFPAGWVYNGRCPDWVTPNGGRGFNFIVTSGPQGNGNCSADGGVDAAFTYGQPLLGVGPTRRYIALKAQKVPSIVRIIRESWHLPMSQSLPAERFDATWRPASVTPPKVRGQHLPQRFRPVAPSPGGFAPGAPVPGEILPGQGQSPPGLRPPGPRPSGHRFKKPGPGRREEKLEAANRETIRFIQKLLAGATGSIDVVQAMYESLPKCRLRRIYKELGRQPTVAEKAWLIARHGSEGNPLLALYNLAANHFDDYVIGKGNQTFGRLDHPIFGQNSIGSLSRVGGGLGKWFGSYERGEFDLGRGGLDASAPVNSALGELGAMLTGSDSALTKSDVRRLLRRADKPCKD